ncbi:MAG: hypothetical protein IJ419_15840 [Agathobacter sp.]|nr:hypothetical protein [Agathobacter sp.]
MRKIRVLLLMLMTVCLIGCSTPEPTDEGSTQPERGITHVFSSYEEFEEWFKPDENKNIPAQEDLNKYTNIYNNLINNIIQGDIQIMKAYLGEEKIPFSTTDGVSNIYLYSDGLYFRPSISYYCSITDEICIIRIIYLDEDEMNYANEHTIDEFVKYIAPYEVNLDDWKYSSVTNVSIESLELSDRTVSALCIERNIPSIDKIFVYDNMYISITGGPEVFDEDIWKTFSLRAE